MTGKTQTLVLDIALERKGASSAKRLRRKTQIGKARMAESRLVRNGRLAARTQRRQQEVQRTSRHPLAQAAQRRQRSRGRKKHGCAQKQKTKADGRKQKSEGRKKTNPKTNSKINPKINSGVGLVAFVQSPRQASAPRRATSKLPPSLPPAYPQPKSFLRSWQETPRRSFFFLLLLLLLLLPPPSSSSFLHLPQNNDPYEPRLSPQPSNATFLLTTPSPSATNPAAASPHPSSSCDLTSQPKSSPTLLRKSLRQHPPQPAHLRSPSRERSVSPMLMPPRSPIHHLCPCAQQRQSQSPNNTPVTKRENIIIFNRYF